jgi:hypothetical protein
MKAKALIGVMLLGLVATFPGCAGRTYLIDVNYISEEKAPPTTKVVGICPFEDMRKEKESNLIGVRHRPGKNVDLLKLEAASLSEAVTDAVKDYYTEQGYEVTDCKGWDKTAEGLDRLPGDLSLVVGGKIHSFAVEATSGIMISTVQYTVKMEALIGKIAERKLLIRTIESTPRDKKVGFTPDGVKAKLNSTLTEVIQNLFK